MGIKNCLFLYLISITLIISLFTNIFILGPLVTITRADPGDIPSSWDNSTTLNVTVLENEPRINWYDFQYNNSGTWESKLNQQIDIDNTAEYRFKINISSDQGWSDIDYINITAWHDLGSEASNYNGTAGGNINLNLSYINTSGTASWYLAWPDDEVTLVTGDCNETEETDPDGSTGNTECYNITFAFIPSYQFRYAPGDGGGWDTSVGHNDIWSWNFNITVEDASGYLSDNNPTKGGVDDEFGVFSYTEISSVGWPTITGSPGDTPAYNDSFITIETRSNGNYSLSVNLSELVHEVNPVYTIANTSILTAGGDIGTLNAFSGTGPQWYYGATGGVYETALNDGTSNSTTDIEWAVNIPLGQYPGEYESIIYYHLLTETG
jgi:hypothetical protein